MTYEYKCEKCSNIEEVSMKMSDDHPPFVLCSKCRGKAPRYFTVTPIVPDHMRATTDNAIRYDKNTQVHGRKYF